MSGVVTDLFIYPVKGSAVSCRARLRSSRAVGSPGDPAFALARPDGRSVAAGQRQALPKDQFLMLSKDERLAGWGSPLDPCSSHATVSVPDHEVLSCDLDASEGIAAFEQLFAGVLDVSKERGPAAGSLTRRTGAPIYPPCPRSL